MPDKRHNKLLFSKINLIKTGTGKKAMNLFVFTQAG